MTAIDEAMRKLTQLLEEHPAAASAALLSVAVEREVIGEKEARAMAGRVGLEDFERIKAILAQEVTKAGRRDELVDLMREGRRIQRRAGTLLKSARKG